MSTEGAAFFLISSFLKLYFPFMSADRFAQMFNSADMHLLALLGKFDLNSIPGQVGRETELFQHP